MMEFFQFFILGKTQSEMRKKVNNESNKRKIGVNMEKNEFFFREKTDNIFFLIAVHNFSITFQFSGWCIFFL